MKKIVKETSKKIALGALAILATIGSVSADPAPIDPQTMPKGSDFEITNAYHGDISVSGYQTARAYTYELNVSWGDMQFVFDRGVYDTSVDKLVKKITATPYDYCEAGIVESGGPVTTPGVGVDKWCGFNGVNNHVNVENKGNGNVSLSVECTEGILPASPAQTLGNVDMQIAIKSSDMAGGSTNDGWAFSSGAQTTNKMMKPKTGDPCEMTVASGSATAATTTLKKAFDPDTGAPVSSQANANTVEFYLNIHGTPQQTATNGSTNSAELNTCDPDQTVSWDTIGTINLTFTGLTT